MASLWIQTKSAKEPVKLLGHLTIPDALRHYNEFVAAYVAKKPGRAYRPYSGMESVLFDSTGGIFANLYVEPMSPPSKPEPGERRREVA